MQNKYVGDIGDFVKLALLRKLLPNYRLGLIWWLVADEQNKGDGRHVKYFEGNRSAHWRSLDMNLFDGLRTIVMQQRRHIGALESAHFLPNCLFVSEPIPLPLNVSERMGSREAWIGRARDLLKECNLLFLDPDNGLEPIRFRPNTKGGIKAVTFRDLECLQDEKRILIVY